MCKHERTHHESMSNQRFSAKRITCRDCYEVLEVTLKGIEERINAIMVCGWDLEARAKMLEYIEELILGPRYGPR